MEQLEENIWKTASLLSKNELEDAIRNLYNDLRKASDSLKKAKIERIILLANYLINRQSIGVFERENYKEIMNILNIKNGNTMRNYLHEIKDKTYTINKE